MGSSGLVLSFGGRGEGLGVDRLAAASRSFCSTSATQRLHFRTASVLRCLSRAFVRVVSFGVCFMVVFGIWVGRKVGRLVGW